MLPRLPRGVVSGAAFRATEDRLRAAGAIQGDAENLTAAEMLQSQEAREVVATLPASQLAALEAAGTAVNFTPSF